MIYKHFHKQLFAHYGIEPEEWIIDEVYDEFFKHIDACDNGIDLNCEIIPRSLGDVVNGFDIEEKDC